MRSILIPPLAIAAALVAAAAGGQLAQAQAQCPEGQVRTAEGACAPGQPGTGMPATQHQQEVLKLPKETATTGTTSTGDIPATQHQQNVLEPEPGGQGGQKQ